MASGPVKEFFDLVGDDYRLKIRVLERGKKYIGCYSLSAVGSSWFTNPSYQYREEFDTVKEAVADARANAKRTIRTARQFRTLPKELLEYAGDTPVVKHTAPVDSKQRDLFNN